MHNKLLAAAVLAAISGVASAQSANVTLYGTLLSDFQFASATGADSSTPQLVTGGSSTRTYAANPANQSTRSRMNTSGSNFGIRGVEDLGNNLQAWFQLELSATLGSPGNGASAHNHGNAPAYRNSAVGLRSSTWGQVFVGTWDLPFTAAAGSTFNANARVSNATTNLIANTLGALGSMGGGGTWSAQNENAACAAGATGVSSGSCLNAGSNFDRRQKATLQWWSPNWSGFEARVAYAATQFSDANTADNRGAGALKPNIWDLSLAYNNGPLGIGYAYSRQNDLLAYASATLGGAGITGGAGTGTYVVTPGTVSGSTGTGHRIGGKYTFALSGGSSIGLGAMWESLKWDINYNASTAGDLTQLKKTGWRLQGNFTTGNHFIGLEFAKSNEIKGTTFSTPGAATFATGLRNFDGGGSDSKAWVLTYNYAFSKRTSITAYYVRIDNNTNSVNTGINSTGIATAAGADPQYYGLNLRHTF